MQKILLHDVEKYAKQNKRRRIWRKIVRVMACVVVFCTTYALILPAITLEKTQCDLSEHTHSESCYEKVTPDPVVSLACTYESLGVHVHTSDCYDGENQLICGQADYLIHVHDDDCMDESGMNVCQIPAISAHEHAEACYRVVETEPAETETTATETMHSHGDECYTAQRGELICQQIETEGHTHGETCFTRGELICQLTEQEGHAHDTSCYESLLTCELSEAAAHLHTDGCYEKNTVLTCQLEEHTSSEATAETQETTEPILELICTEPVAQVHIHDESCFLEASAQEDPLTCTLPEDETHTHSVTCYGTWELVCGKEEHTHDLVCRNDPEADVETEAIWKATFADVTLTGEWDEDMLAIARSQLGYEESTRNYAVMDDGETIKGYTRYGAWYGDPYGDWCAMFVSFCLHYAGVEDMPVNSSCPKWIEKLADEKLYHLTGEYIPVSGDLVFFDWDENEISDHVGIVAEVIPATETEPAMVKTIEGNIGDRVAEQEYELDDSIILGYGMLPEKEPVYCCGFQKHTHDASCMDENGELICGMEEHTHTSDCGTLTDEEWTQVQQVIALIDEMPSSEEIDAKLMEYEEAGDLAGQDVYFEEVWTQVCEVYAQYAMLSDEQRACVTNAEKLLALEYMWANQEEASTYVAKISGYNMDANNIFGVDGYLGVDAGYAADGVNKGKWASHTKQVMDKCNVIFVNLPKPDGVHRANIGTFFLGSNWTTLIEKRTKQGHFSVNLYDDWCAIRVEPSTTYPFYVAEQIIVNDDEVQRIGRITHVSDSGYVVLVRKSYIKSEGLYMPEKSAGKFAMVHMNKEILWTKIGRRDFIEDPGWLPGNTADASTLGPFAYMTLSPIVTNYADKALAGERSDDRDVVSNIKFKLFDYSNYINKTTQSDKDDSYRALASYFYFRGGIDKNANRDYDLDVARYTPNVNPELMLDGAGHKLYDQDGYTLYHARVEPNLWNGYPRLDFTVDAKGNPMDPPDGWGTGEMQNPRSLRFLFDESYAYSYWPSNSKHAVAPGAVTEYAPQNTILQFDEDTHTYWYDSSKNAVDYDIDAQLFRVREYTERTSITADWPFGDVPDDTGDFLPFNYSNGIVNATYHPGTQLAQGGIMDSSFPMNDVNYWFGMSMEFTFLQGEDGTVTYTDSNGVKHTDVMEFKFSGDDDVWVFIDGVRILDLGGTHGSVDGSINFKTGKVVQKMTWEENSNKSFPTTLQKCFTLAGQTPKGGWDSDGAGTPGERFADYSVHTLKFFYLERGTAVANCSIEFNLPNFDTPLVVGKTLSAANEDVDPEVLGYLQDTQEYSYRVLVADENGDVLKDENGDPILFMREGQVYTLVDYANIQRIGTKLEVGKNGIFKVKHGQQAVFEDILTIAQTIAVDDGKAAGDYKYFVIEEILPNEQTGHYNKIQYTIDTDVGTMMGEADDTLQDFMGYYTPAISVGEPQHVQYNNTVDTETLSVLKITKAVTEASEFAEDQEFTIRVKLDGEYLPEGTEYVVTDANGNTVGTYAMGVNGSIVLKKNQTAEILVPVLAGTTYEVEEVAEESWVVTYKSVTTDANGTATESPTGTGTFPLDGSVHVTVTNSTYEYRLGITILKRGHGLTAEPTTTFTFYIKQVDADGNEVTENIVGTFGSNSIKVPLEDGELAKEFYIAFEKDDPTGVYYYKITEEAYSGWICDTKEYVVKVQVYESGGVKKAKILSVTKDGETYSYSSSNPITFVNYKKLSVTVDKTVTGNYTEAELQKPFSFTAVVTLDGKQVAPEAGDGYTVASNGTVTFTLTHDQAVTINGIPYGATVTVTESGAPGYSTHYTLNDFAQKHSSSSAEVSGVISNNTIHFVNKGGYKLPETGGAGTTIYAMAGLVLICFSMAYLMYRPKARRRGEFKSP